MTKKECAIIMAHTGICMLQGEDFNIFHEYVEKIIGRPVWTHEMGIPKMADLIKEKSLDDFLELCKNAVDDNDPNVVAEKDGVKFYGQ